MTKNSARISSAEWQIMETLWRKSPLSASETFESLESDADWHIKTVRTLLDRLVQKGAIRKRKVHGMYVFSPIPKREQCVRAEGSSFLGRFFRGDPISMIAHFIEHEDLSEEDIGRLEQLLQTKSSPKKKGR